MTPASAPFTERLFAGVHSSSTGVASVASEQSVRECLAAEGAVCTVLSTESIVVAASGGQSACEPRPTSCVLDGKVENLDGLARELGLPPSSPAEEVLATAYGCWGEELLERLRGPFAVVIWDSVRRAGVVAVDRFGSRPLFFATDGPVLRFASEVRNLVRLCATSPVPDSTTLLDYIIWGQIAPGSTHFKEVERLRGGEYIRLGQAPFARRVYWKPRYRGTSDASRGELVADLRALIADAIRKRMPSDGRPVGVLMSGGLDSSTVAGVCRAVERAGGNEVLAYSGIFPANSSVDESSLIESLRAHLEIPIAERAFTGRGMVGAFLEFLAAYQLPTVTPNLFFLLPLQQQAFEDGVRVFFDGDGGDEVFGCSAYLLADRVLRLRIRDAVRLTSQLPFGEAPDRRTIDHYFREYALRGAVPYFLHRRKQTRRLRESPPEWLTEVTATSYAGGRIDTVEWKRARGPRWWRYLAYLVTRNKELGGLYDMTRRIRRMSGLTPAHPFTDDADLIDFALEIPPELLFSQTHSRPLLREAMRGIVPDEILRRHGKAVFTNLLRDDLTGPDGQFALELLSNPNAEINAYVRREITSDLAARALRGEELGDDLWVVWRLLATECWLQSQADPGFAERAASQLRRASSTQ